MEKSSSKLSYDAIIVGAGPNGLSAAITLAKSGLKVLLVEASKNPGGGSRSENLTLPGFTHDVCSAVHPMALASPFFRTLPLEKHGLQWIHPPSPLAHPLDSDRVVLLERSVEATANQLGIDSERYYKLMAPFAKSWEEIVEDFFSPVAHFPRHPFIYTRFGLSALQSANYFARKNFKSDLARALFAGSAAHSMVPLTWIGSSAIGLMLTLMGHACGWPIAKGGSQSIAQALISYFQSLGGELMTEFKVSSLKELPSSRWVILNLTPKQVLQVAKNELSYLYQRSLNRYQYGPGIFKIDWALSSPIPWKNAKCLQAATVHLGGTLEEIIRSEKAMMTLHPSDDPFVLLSQPTLFDPSRAPPNQHIAWAYCHVPHGSRVDMTSRIEDQVERYAPGFKKTILSKSTMNTLELENRNMNLVGGDIGGGLNSLKQILFRPTKRLSPYQTSSKRIYICSASTPPGAGVHGMCGFNAAQHILNKS